MTPLRLATSQDLPAILGLLEDAGLPYQDLAPAHLADFVVTAGGRSVLGIVGLERYGDDALLRSLVVWPESRFTGLGTQLADAVERMSSGPVLEPCICQQQPLLISSRAAGTKSLNVTAPRGAAGNNNRIF